MKDCMPILHLCNLSLITFFLSVNPSHASHQLVTDLTDSNFDNVTASGAWMIEIYAQWCSHCRQLEPHWKTMAKELESSGIRTGKINGPENRVLMSRFGVKGFPSIYYIKGTSTWIFEGSRSVQAMKEFALSGHKLEEPLPFWRSPTGIVGRLMGHVHRIPFGIKEAYSLLKEEKGMSDLAILAWILAIPVLVGAFTICLVDGLFLRQARIAESLQHAHPHEH
ncbi:hypothetical protein CEUSTIGMA_g9140.t1 [Chlamydomonas eustigma]|uniref:Thioredoxin domain-containing protein n=1 Tax=Chlamydomonas eustigma TaxID=1157962 RepID=A0A250XFM6_9CHLO|nr:hypothetical protein CEUSTIGMA_g9140.t1 [Chlamydomonas eustigma]|eukprot:GAX81712.1 hypothetical protein CEUSTIGMA_g9140.t1 [Chlamydomonas eustigma]